MIVIDCLIVFGPMTWRVSSRSTLPWSHTHRSSTDTNVPSRPVVDVSRRNPWGRSAWHRRPLGYRVTLAV